MDLLLVPVALILGVLALIAKGLVLRLRHGKPSPEELEYEKLRARYARGAITRQEYMRLRHDAARPRGAPAAPPVARRTG
jgi:uncharacterized membrane protein